MNWRRGLLALAGAGVLIFSLSGCFVIVSDTPSQENTIGDVIVHTVACISSGTNTDPCADLGNSNSFFGQSGVTDGQLLIAYRIPNGYGAPTQLKSTSGSPQLVLDASGDYATQLTNLAPPPAGEHWVGYMSGQVSPANNTQYVFDTRFTRPPAQNGVPSSTPFQYLTLTGGREITSGEPADRPLNCGTTFADLVGQTFPPIDGTYCVDSPPIASTDTQLPADKVLFTRDLAIAPGTASANRNSTVNVPFTLNWVGPADPSAVFTLGSSTNGLSGAAATPANATFNPPANSSTVQNVVVKLPATARAGTYDVPFSATLANGQTRQATGTVTVLPDTKGPRVTISLARTRLAKGARRGLSVTVGCDEDCSLVASLTATPAALKAARSVKLASARAKLPAAGKVKLKLKPTRSGKRKLQALANAHKKLKGKLVVVATDGLGNKTTASKRISLK